MKERGDGADAVKKKEEGLRWMGKLPCEEKRRGGLGCVRKGCAVRDGEQMGLIMEKEEMAQICLCVEEKG